MIIKNTNSEYKEFSLEKDQFKVFEAHDVENLLVWNWQDRKRNEKYWLDPKEKELLHVARIPQITYAAWYKKYPELRDPETSQKFLLKLLDEEENHIFKTTAGHLT